jgi:hypothetical protein
MFFSFEPSYGFDPNFFKTLKKIADLMVVSLQKP